MFIDAQQEFSDLQAITADAISTNVIDLIRGTDNTLIDIGSGPDSYLVVRVGTAFDNLTTLNVTLESDSTTDLATSPTVHLDSGAVALAALTADTVIYVAKLPPDSYERYLGVRYNVTGTNPTAGTIDAFLTPNAKTLLDAYAARTTITV